MGLLKARLLRKFGSGHDSLIDSADKFETKKLVKMLKVHREV